LFAAFRPLLFGDLTVKKCRLSCLTETTVLLHHNLLHAKPSAVSPRLQNRNTTSKMG